MNFEYDETAFIVHCPDCDVRTASTPVLPENGLDLALVLTHAHRCKFRKTNQCRYCDPAQWVNLNTRICQCGQERPKGVSDTEALSHLFKYWLKTTKMCWETLDTFNPGLWNPHHDVWTVITNNIVSSRTPALNVIDFILSQYRPMLVLDRALNAQEFNENLRFIVEYMLESHTFDEVPPSSPDFETTGQEAMPPFEDLELSTPTTTDTSFALPTSESTDAGTSFALPLTEATRRVTEHRFIRQLRNDLTFQNQLPRGMSFNEVMRIANTIEPDNSYTRFRKCVQEKVIQWQQESSINTVERANTFAEHTMSRIEFDFLVGASGLPEEKLKQLLAELSCITPGSKDNSITVSTMNDERVFGEYWNDFVKRNTR